MKLLTLLSLMVIFSACSSKEPDKKPVVYPEESSQVSTTSPKEISITAKQVAAEQGSNFVSEFRFKRGETALTEDNRQKLKAVYDRAQRKGQIKEVQIVTWADQNFPTKRKEELASDQKKLVERRNASIEKYLSQLDTDLDVKKISMAERAGALARFTASDEAKIKEGLDSKDAPDKVSESMVIFILKD